MGFPMARALVLSALSDLTGRKQTQIADDCTLQGDLGLSDGSLGVLVEVLGLYGWDDGDSKVDEVIARLQKCTVQELIALAITKR
jgi:hypothetical protein